MAKTKCPVCKVLNTREELKKHPTSIEALNNFIFSVHAMRSIEDAVILIIRYGCKRHSDSNYLTDDWNSIRSCLKDLQEATKSGSIGLINRVTTIMRKYPHPENNINIAQSENKV